MSITSPEVLVAVVMTDLESYCASQAIPPRSTRPYAEPTIVLPDHCPMLAVWCEETTYEILTTAPLMAYERRHLLSVAWYVSNPKQSESGGVGDPAVVLALGNTVEQLLVELETYTAGIPTIGNQLVATLRRRELAPLEGTVWRGLVELDVAEAA